MSAQDEDREHTLCPGEKGALKEAGMKYPPSHFIVGEKKQPVFISIFGFLKPFLSLTSKEMIFLREIKWLNTFNLSLNAALLNLIIKPYRF